MKVERKEANKEKKKLAEGEKEVTDKAVRKKT